MSEIIVEVDRLNKSFGDVKAVNDVSFSIERDKIYGLLGRNGAGKSTIMSILTAQLFADSGKVKILGEAPYENNRVLSQICFIKESQKYPDIYCAGDVLDLSASLFPNWDKAFARSLAEEFRLPLRRRIKKLSRGMLSSVGIIVGLASRAPLTIFDEPYLGLDAVARGLFYDRLIEDYHAYPRTVILSTHLIDEVSRILEHVLVIDNGKLIIDEDADTLRGSAYTVAGSAAKVESLAAGKNVLYRESLGALNAVTIMGNLNPEVRKQAAALDLELTSVSLQQFIVHLTSGVSERKVAE